MIQLSGVSKGYSEQSRVLDRVHLNLARGEFVYVVGGSGAGKSTLLRILATEEQPSVGKVELFGFDVARGRAPQLAAVRRAVGYIPQNVRLIPDLTVFENIAMSVSLAGRKATTSDPKKLIGFLMERLGLTAKKDRPASALSGGEAQRVAVARALARAPELILADEPTGAQDNEYTWAMMDLLARANTSGATVIVATHDREIVTRMRKRCLLLRQGQLVQETGMAGGLCI